MEKTKKGFTLIELLVVIAIIAMLLAVIVPSLRMAKDQAKKTICQSNLKQWGVIWYMYLEANKSVFPTPWSGSAANNKQHWFSVTRPYYQDPDIRCCASAANPDKKGVTTFNTWGPMPAATPTDWWEEGDYGSYALSSWTMNPPTGATTFLGAPVEYYWGKRTAVKNPSAVPLMADAMWVDGWPDYIDTPPTSEGVGGTGNMNRFCLNRHNGYAGVLFMDYSIKMVGLKSLWSLKWHRLYDTGYAEKSITWPEWMAKFK